MKESVSVVYAAYDNVFTALASEVEVVHGTPKGVDGRNGIKVAHSFGVRSGQLGVWYKSDASALQTADYDIFQMP